MVLLHKGKVANKWLQDQSMRADFPAFIVSFLMFFLIASGLKEFYAWHQVLYIWNYKGKVPLELWDQHFFRYIIAYPGLYLKALFPPFGFSIYCLIFFVLNVVLLSRIFCKVFGMEPSFLWWCFFISAHFFMNGRGVIAWTAWLSCIAICIDLNESEKKVRKAGLRFVGTCFLAMVSTGVFIVVVSSIFLFVFNRIKQLGFSCFLKTRSLFAFFALLPFVFLFANRFYVAIYKNISFYGGGGLSILNMLDHGAGKFFLDLDSFGRWLMLFLISPFFSVLALFLFCRKKSRVDEKLLLITIIGGFFGYTVLTLSIPLLFIQFERVLSHSQRCVN